MKPSAWVASLTDAAFQRGWLTRAAQGKAHLLVQQGLHPEQVLVGTGLLSADQYAACAQICWNRAPVRLDVDSLHVVLPVRDDGRSIGLEDEEGKRWYAVADVWETQAHAPKGYALLTTFFADIERLLRKEEVVDLAAAEWLEAVRAVHAHELKLGVDEGRGSVLLGPADHGDEVLAVGREEVPALQAWLMNGYGSAVWDARLRSGLESHWVEAVSRQEPHPVERMHGWQTRLKSEKGVLVIVDPDHWVLRQLEDVPRAEAFHELFGDGPRKRVIPQNDREREEAMHAVLAGAPLCWIEEDPEADLPRFRALARLGIPVTMLRHRLTLHGSAWEVYDIEL